MGTRVEEAENRNKRDVKQHGMTPGCPGCIAVNRGAAARGRTEACRRRMDKDMVQSGGARIDRYNQRIVVASKEMEPSRKSESNGPGLEEDGKRRRTDQADKDLGEGEVDMSSPTGATNSQDSIGG